MGQDAMTTGLSVPSFSSDLPPRERVFLRGLYSDVEARLGRIDSGIGTLRRRVRDFDGVLDSQIRRCESAEDRVRSLRDDFSRMDREISEMTAELGHNLEVDGYGKQDANEDDIMEGDQLQSIDSSVDFNMQVGQPSTVNSRAELRRNCSTDRHQTMETIKHGSTTNLTDEKVTTKPAVTNQKTKVSKSCDSIPKQSSHHVVHGHFPNSSRLTGVHDGNSKETHDGIDSYSPQLRNRHQSWDRDIGDVSIHQDNNAVSIGVVCNINDPTANEPGRSNMASRIRPPEGRSRELPRAEQQLVDLARELNEFRKTIATSTNMNPNDCLVETPCSSNGAGAASTTQHTEIGQGATGIQTATVNVNRLERPQKQSPENDSIENRQDRYKEFDSYVEEIIKRHSREVSQEFNKSDQTIHVRCDEEEERRDLDPIEPLKQESGTLAAEGVFDENDSPSDSAQRSEPEVNSQELTSSASAAESTCDERDSPCVSNKCQHGACQKAEATSSNSSASGGACCHQATTSTPSRRCLERLLYEHLPSNDESNSCGRCLRDVLATYVRHFIQLLHSRVTQEVRKRSKVKHRGVTGRTCGRATDADISRARDAVFGRLGLTIPMLEVLMEFDHHYQTLTVPEQSGQVDPAHVTDDNIHRLLVTMGMSWHAMNNQLYDNDCAFRIAIATVHAQMHHVD